MISVLTLTYQRHHILEEAIQSFLMQDVDAEMVVLNDSAQVKYEFSHPKVRIINFPRRFRSVGVKIDYGWRQCQHPYVYRLDDDDMIAPGGLALMRDAIITNPGYEIYRSKAHYLFVNNKFKDVWGSVNNGNCYSKKYLERIKIPDKMLGQDVDMTLRNSPRTFTLKEPTMIYRWGGGTWHISAIRDPKKVYDKVDERATETGVITLKPKFLNSYYEQIT